MDGNDNHNVDCLSKKGVGQGKRSGGIERWVCFFHAVLFCYCFLAYLFQCRSIDFVVVAACCRYHRGEKKVSQWYYIYFYFVGSGSVVVAAWRQRWQQRQHGCGGQLSGGGGSLAEARF
jgi:hypothetical protein